MTTEGLHKILDDENKEISIKEFQNLVYELKRDCFDELHNKKDITANEVGYYNGEINAFYLVLDLSEHIIDQSEQIRSLEEQLNKAICPKFKIGQELFWLSHWEGSDGQLFYEIYSCKVCKIIFSEERTFYSVTSDRFMDKDYQTELEETILFATREEALARLAELEGK